MFRLIELKKIKHCRAVRKFDPGLQSLAPSPLERAGGEVEHPVDGDHPDLTSPPFPVSARDGTV